jgi:aryl-alcohol dehydrogenase-like predicted oxidoreductase
MNKENSIIRGCWQLAADHSQQNATIQPIQDAIDCGFTIFDCGDIYLGVEELLGQAVRANSKQKLSIHTKFVPDLGCLRQIDRAYVEKIIDRSLSRLQVECIDLVQFHWWDWEVKNYFFAMDILSQLKAKGKIAAIGLTNVNSQYLEEFAARFDIASLQMQVSLFDKRVTRGIGDLCREKGIKIYAYGTLLGGFLSEKWLMKTEPEMALLENRSLVKYKLLIDAACGWVEFQRRLNVLNDLANKYHSDIASMAIAGLIQGGQINAAIAGLSPHNYSEQNRKLAHLPILSTHDLQSIEAWTCDLKGDAYDEERVKSGVHARVMKYNLNAK